MKGLRTPTPFVVPIELTVEERAQLEGWERRGSSALALALRSRIVLAAAAGPGRPRTVTDEQIEEVIVKTLETTPTDATHRSTRSMAREVGLTQSAVLRIWRAFGLPPHRQDTWRLTKDPQFIDKVRDVVGLCLNPPERAVVLWAPATRAVR